MTAPGRPPDEPMPLRDAVAAVGRELGMPSPDALATLTAAWPTIAGDPLASHTSVRSVRGGVCTVEADGAGWATQLRYAEDQLVERIRACCGTGIVRSVRTVVRGGAVAP
jgi:predicted nucleic acid-binding Zn ribbon protein